MAIVVFTLIGSIPNAKYRRVVNDVLFKMAFRLLCRPLSAVVTFHNTQYRPTSTGFCVANHTSPMDVAILGADCTYSLVRILDRKKRLAHHIILGGIIGH